MKQIHYLDLHEVPPASIGRFWLTLAHNNMGQSRVVPITVLQGKLPGPTLGITTIVRDGATDGIPLIHQLVEKVDVTKLRGTIICAFLLDLPAVSPTSHGQPDSNSYLGGVTAKLLDRLDYLINLRADSADFTSIHTVHADKRGRETALLIRPLDAPLIVNTPAVAGSLRAAAQWLNIPAVTMTLGQKRDLPLASIFRLLNDLDLLYQETDYRPSRTEDYRSACWIKTQAAGLLDVYTKAGEFVERGQVIAELSDLFGRVMSRYTAPDDGVVVCRNGARLVAKGVGIVQLAIGGQSMRPMAADPLANMVMV